MELGGLGSQLLFSLRGDGLWGRLQEVEIEGGRLGWVTPGSGGIIGVHDQRNNYRPPSCWLIFKPNKSDQCLEL